MLTNINMYFLVLNVQRPSVGLRRRPVPPRNSSVTTSSSTSKLIWKTQNSEINNSTLVKSTLSRSGSIFDEESRIVIALCEGRGEATCEVGIAAIDVSRPCLIVCQISDTASYVNTLTKINVLNPDEILIPQTFVKTQSSSRLITKVKSQFENVTITALPRSVFNKINGMQHIKELCAPEWDAILLVLEHKYYALTAAAALLNYTENVLYFRYAANSIKVEYQESEGFAIIDVQTADKLELVASTLPSAGKKYTSLFGVLNHCHTRIGARTLRASILQPPCSVPDIEARLECVTELKRNSSMMSIVQATLSKLSNIDQLLSLATVLPDKEINYSERQLNYILMLNKVLEVLAPLHEVFKNSKQPFFMEIRNTLGSQSFKSLYDLVKTLIHPDAHPAKGEKGIFQRCFAIKSGINALLDIVRKSYSERIDDMREYVKTLGQKYNMALKMNNNNKKGYHIVLALNSYQKRNFRKSELPPEFIQVERLTSIVTMKTPELINYSTRIDDILHEILKLSNIMIYNILVEVQKQMSLFYKLCEDIAKLDMLQSLAEASNVANYVRPKFGEFLEVYHSRHPLLDFLCSKEPVSNSFVATNEHNVHIISGPNGSGKSIFIRQVLLLQVMAQVGCFVPAQAATFKVCDRILARIYFEDNMDCGASAFVLEIKDIQYFQAVMTKNTLIIIDELCRSTAIEEGTALAMAILEELKNSGAFIFFTTHFIFITKLADLYLNIRNWQLETTATVDANGRAKLNFTFNVMPGVTTFQRYGIFTARLSWPASVVDAAEAELNKMCLPNETPAVLSINMRDRLKYDLEADLKLLKLKKQLTPERVHERLAEYVENMRQTGVDMDFADIRRRTSGSSNNDENVNRDDCNKEYFADVEPNQNPLESNDAEKDIDNMLEEFNAIFTPVDSVDAISSPNFEKDVVAQFNKSLENVPNIDNFYIFPEVVYSEPAHSVCSGASEIQDDFQNAANLHDNDNSHFNSRTGNVNDKNESVFTKPYPVNPAPSNTGKVSSKNDAKKLSSSDSLSSSYTMQEQRPKKVINLGEISQNFGDISSCSEAVLNIKKYGKNTPSHYDSQKKHSITNKMSKENSGTGLNENYVDNYNQGYEDTQILDIIATSNDNVNMSREISQILQDKVHNIEKGSINLKKYFDSASNVEKRFIPKNLDMSGSSENYTTCNDLSAGHEENPLFANMQANWVKNEAHYSTTKAMEIHSMPITRCSSTSSVNEQRFSLPLQRNVDKTSTPIQRRNVYSKTQSKRSLMSVVKRDLTQRHKADDLKSATFRSASLERDFQQQSPPNSLMSSTVFNWQKSKTNDEKKEVVPRHPVRAEPHSTSNDREAEIPKRYLSERVRDEVFGRTSAAVIEGQRSVTNTSSTKSIPWKAKCSESLNNKAKRKERGHEQSSSSDSILWKSKHSSDAKSKDCQTPQAKPDLSVGQTPNASDPDVSAAIEDLQSCSEYFSNSQDWDTANDDVVASQHHGGIELNKIASDPNNQALKQMPQDECAKSKPKIHICSVHVFDVNNKLVSQTFNQLPTVSDQSNINSGKQVCTGNTLRENFKSEKNTCKNLEEKTFNFQPDNTCGKLQPILNSNEEPMLDNEKYPINSVALPVTHSKNKSQNLFDCGNRNCNSHSDNLLQEVRTYFINNENVRIRSSCEDNQGEPPKFDEYGEALLLHQKTRTNEEGTNNLQTPATPGHLFTSKTNNESGLTVPSMENNAEPTRKIDELKVVASMQRKTDSKNKETCPLVLTQAATAKIELNIDENDKAQKTDALQELTGNTSSDVLIANERAHPEDSQISKDNSTPSKSKGRQFHNINQEYVSDDIPNEAASVSIQSVANVGKKIRRKTKHLTILPFFKQKRPRFSNVIQTTAGEQSMHTTTDREADNENYAINFGIPTTSEAANSSDFNTQICARSHFSEVADISRYQNVKSTDATENIRAEFQQNSDNAPNDLKSGTVNADTVTANDDSVDLIENSQVDSVTIATKRNVKQFSENLVRKIPNKKNVFESSTDISFSLDKNSSSDIFESAYDTPYRSSDCNNSLTINANHKPRTKCKKFKTPVKSATSSNALIKQFKAPKMPTKREIQQEFYEQDVRMLETCDDTNASKYMRQLLNRPSVKQLQKQKHIAVLRNTSEGVVIVPTPIAEKKRKTIPMKKIRSTTNFDITVFSDKNSDKFDHFLQAKKGNSTPLQHETKNFQDDNLGYFECTATKSQNKSSYSNEHKSMKFNFGDNKKEI